MKRTLALVAFLLAVAVGAQCALRASRVAAAPALAEGAYAALGGLRSLAAEVIWFRADRLQEEGRYVELAQLAATLAAMEPHTPEIWSYAAWNLAYNVSVMMPSAEDRWRWVEAGVSLLRDRGLVLNPGSPELCRELAWLFELKIGADIDSAAGTYRTLWRRKVGDVKARGAWEELGMRPHRMLEIERATGFDDWGDACLSAIYWASEGLLHARGPVRNQLLTIIHQSRVIYGKRHLATALADAADFDVRAYGAKGDGAVKDTAAIQRTIDAANASGGGRVVLTNGTFLTGPIVLKSGVELHLAANARLLASPDIADFPDWPEVRHVISANLPRGRNISVIFADEAENVAITGKGTIDGNGLHHVREKTDPNWTGWRYERKYPLHESLPRVVFFAGCRNVRLRDVTMVNPPAGWSYWIHDCDRVDVRGLKIAADVRYPNNDGLHFNCSRDVTVEDCDIACGDDAIVVRANSRSLRENKPMERLSVRRCRLRSWSSGVRFGWTNDGVIRDCSFSDIVMEDTTVGLAFVLPQTFPYDYGREATRIENITFENIEMKAIYAHPIYAGMSDDPATRIEAVRDIRFRNVTARSLELPYFDGRPETPYSDFTFENCRFTLVTDAELPDSLHHGAAAWDRHRFFRFRNVRGFAVKE